MNEAEKPEQVSRRRFISRGAKMVAALGFTSGVTVSSQGAGEKGQTEDILRNLPATVKPETRAEFAENLAEIASRGQDKMGLGTTALLPCAALYTALAITDERELVKQAQNSGKSKEEIDAGRRAFLTSTTEIATTGVGLVATSHAIESAARYGRARDARKMMPASMDGQQRGEVSAMLRNHQQDALRSAWNAGLVAAGAAVLSHAERLSRKDAEEEARNKGILPRS